MGRSSCTMAALWAVFALILGTSAALQENIYARLLDDLFEDTGYNKNAIPLEIPADKDSNKNALNVGVGMSIISMDYHQAGIMSASTWFKATWKDYRLQWDPKQYGGIENIKVPATMVWRPDLSVYNGTQSNTEESRTSKSQQRWFGGLILASTIGPKAIRRNREHQSPSNDGLEA